MAKQQPPRRWEDLTPEEQAAILESLKKSVAEEVAKKLKKNKEEEDKE